MTVFINLNRQLRRHRRKAMMGLAVLATAAVAMSASTALMGGMDHHMGDAAGICLAVGGCVAVVSISAFAILRLRRRPLWLIAAPPLPALPFVPAGTGFLVRAGPPPLSLSQVFRL